MIRHYLRLLLPIAIIFFVAQVASAAFPDGDVASAVAARIAQPPNGAIFIIAPDGTRTALSSNAVPTAIAFDAERRLWVSEQHGIPDQTRVWSSSATQEATFPFGGESLVFDAAGNLYVSGVQLGQPAIRKFSSAGALLATYSPPRTPMSIDLAADQCTMFVYFDSPRAIGRYDICAGAELPDVPIDPELFAPEIMRTGQQWSFRILPDDSLLIATGSRVVRVSMTGELLQTYTVPGVDVNAAFVAVALDPAGRRFWLGLQATQGDARLYLLDLYTGSIVSGPFPAGNQPLQGIAVAGEPRAALLLPPVEAPALTALALVSLAAILLAVAVRSLA